MMNQKLFKCADCDHEWTISEELTFKSISKNRRFMGNYFYNDTKKQVLCPTCGEGKLFRIFVGSYGQLIRRPLTDMRNNKSYVLFPGCTLTTSAREYYVSTLEVLNFLGINYNEMEDWNCCGSSVGSLDLAWSLVLNARNLEIASKQGDVVFTPCSCCYKNMTKTVEDLGINPAFRDLVEAKGIKVNLMPVKHLAEVIVKDYGLERVKDKVNTPLKGLRVATYYGCQMTRPHSNFDHPFYPTSLDKLAGVLGAEVIDFPYKTKCCGGPILLTNEDIALTLAYKILMAAKKTGADVIQTACPLCSMTLDLYQKRIEEKFGEKFDIPVVYFTQLMGLAFGIKKKALGFDKNVVSPKQLLRQFS